MLDDLLRASRPKAAEYAEHKAKVYRVRVAVAPLIEAASDAAKLLESVAPHHPQTAKLRAALAQAEGGVK